MVFQDISADSLSYTQNTKNFASAQDRFVAAIVDFIIVLPFALLINFPLIKKMKVVEIFYPLASEYVIYFLTVVLITTVIFVFYQTYFLYRYQATFGQMLFKLKVVDTASGQNQLIWTQALIRSFAFVFNFLFFGLPLLEILSHPQRQALHDKVSDTVVVTLKKVWTPIPLNLERSFIRLFLSTFFFVFCFWAIVILSHVVKKADQHLFSQTELIQKNMLCTQVVEGEPDRLKKSVDLYLAQIVSRDCVEQEMQFEYIKQQPSAFAPIAGLYLNLQNDEIFNMYMDQICKVEDSSVCQHAQLIKLHKNKDYEQLKVKLASSFDQALLSQVWLTQVYFDLQNYNKSDELLTQVVRDSQLQNFALMQKFKNLVRTGEIAQAEGVYFAITPYLEKTKPELKDELLSVLVDAKSKDRAQIRKPASSGSVK